MAAESPPDDDFRMDISAMMRALRSSALRIIVVTALLLVATFVVLLFVPRQYESTASLLVEDRSSVYTEAAGTTSNSNSNSSVTIDALTSSQIELVRSRDTLLAVVDSQGLRDIPEFNGGAGSPLTSLLALVGRKPEPRNIDETVLANLNERLTVIRESDSAVISISARSADPELAARLANAIADETVKRRADQSLNDTAEATAWLQQQIDSLRQKVEEADTKVADYRAQNNIFTGSNGTTLPDQQISDIGKQITDAQQARSSAELRASLIRSLVRSGQAVDGVDDIRNSTVIQSLMQNRATLQSTLAEKLATLLPAHPTIIALNAQIDQVNRQISAEADRIADGLEAQVTVQEGLIASLNDDLTRAKLAASTQTKDSVTLDSLTREANAQRQLLDSYLLRYRDAAGRTESGSVLPDVRVITRAAASNSPASPKTALILGAVGFVALALQIGMVLFGELMSGRAVYDRSERAGAWQESEDEPSLEENAVLSRTSTDVFEDAPGAGFAASAGEPDLADVAEPERPVAAAQRNLPPIDWPTPARKPSPTAQGAMQLSSLIADIALGRARVLLVAAAAEPRDSGVAADRLVAESLARGLSVCRVDAGSSRTSAEQGLADLCAEDASFGDVVHKVREGLAEVPWGHRDDLDRRSHRAATLVEALGDIYEVVIVSTGRAGMGSSLPLFAGIRARLVVVQRDNTPAELVDAALGDAERLGFDTAQSILVPERQVEVA